MSAISRRRLLQAGASCAVVPWVAPVGAQSAEGSAVLKAFLGKALDADTGRWLYTEQHRHTYRSGRWVSGVIRYVAPDGTALGEKTLDFSQDRFVPLMRTVYAPLGEEELITRIEPAAVVMETVKGGQRKTRTVNRPAALAVDSGFHAFIQARLDELVSGQTVSLQLGVISQFDHFRFRIRRTGERRVGDQQQVQLVVEADSMLRMLVPTVNLVYDAKTGDMLEYQGMSNIVDPQTRKAPVVRITYDYAV